MSGIRRRTAKWSASRRPNSRHAPARASRAGADYPPCRFRHSKPQREADAGAVEVQPLTTDEQQVDVLHRVQMTDIAANADVRRDRYGEPAADVVAEGIVVAAQRNGRCDGGHVRPDQ